jgi:hypothetical protein
MASHIHSVCCCYFSLFGSVFSDNNLVPLGQHHVSEESGKLLCERCKHPILSCVQASTIFWNFTPFIWAMKLQYFISLGWENVRWKRGDALTDGEECNVKSHWTHARTSVFVFAVCLQKFKVSRFGLFMLYVTCWKFQRMTLRQPLQLKNYKIKINTCTIIRYIFIIWAQLNELVCLIIQCTYRTSKTKQDLIEIWDKLKLLAIFSICLLANEIWLSHQPKLDEQGPCLTCDEVTIW